ncbi:MAG: hypothetical protein AAGA76_09115, partial [Pseudomonadota bacterium]
RPSSVAWVVNTQVPGQLFLRSSGTATAGGWSRTSTSGWPNNYRLVRDAVDRGVTLNEIEQGNNVTKALTQIVLAGEVDADADSGKKGGLLSMGKSLLKRKAG